MTKPSSSSSRGDSDLFGPLSSTPEITACTDRTAWVRAMLAFERALACAEGTAGIIPDSAARDIAEHCRTGLFDVDSIARRAVSSATPVVPLVHDLATLVDSATAAHVHHGATSQDVLDTAAMLITRQAIEITERDLRSAATECARLAGRYRRTPVIGRTLLQQALPTTFGRRCAGWLVTLVEARRGLQRLREQRLALQLGGPVGNLGAFGDQAERVLGLVAAELGLPEPVVPWHTDRTRIGECAGTLGTASGALGKIALDVKLHAQGEVGELSESMAGESSAMPHKHNPVHAVLVTALTARVPGLVGTILSAMPQEYERAAGAWQSEWATLSELLRLVATASCRTREMLAGLVVHPERMSANLEHAPDTQRTVLEQHSAGAEVFIDRALALHDSEGAEGD